MHGFDGRGLETEPRPAETAPVPDPPHWSFDLLGRCLDPGHIGAAGPLAELATPPPGPLPLVPPARTAKPRQCPGQLASGALPYQESPESSKEVESLVTAPGTKVPRNQPGHAAAPGRPRAGHVPFPGGAQARRTMVWAARSPPRSPACSPSRPAEQAEHHYDQEGEHQGPRNPAYRRDSRAARHGHTLKISPRPAPKAATS
jgi:hypothetical protein